MHWLDRPLFAWLPILLIFLVSAVTMRQWAEEQRMGTLEVLLTLPLKTRDLVLGKFLAGLALVALALVLTLPLPITVSQIGDLDWGPVVGGYVVSHMSWRWLFFANLPLALLATWRILLLPPSPPHPGVAALTDVRGLVLFAATAVCWLLWLSFAGHRFAWWSVTSVGMLATAVVLLGVLVHIERRSSAPFLPIELLRVPGVSKMTGTMGDLYLVLANGFMEAGLDRFPTASMPLPGILA